MPRHQLPPSTAPHCLAHREAVVDDKTVDNIHTIIHLISHFHNHCLNKVTAVAFCHLELLPRLTLPIGIVHSEVYGQAVLYVVVIINTELLKG